MTAATEPVRRPSGLFTAGGEKGVALPMALIVLVILTSLAAAVLAVGTSETNIATNHMRTAQALALAEAGLESAFTAINSSLTGTSLISSATTSFASLSVTAPTGALATVGTYSVQYRTIGSNTVEVVSTGTTTLGGARRILRAIMTSNLNSTTAVLAEGDITVSGGTTVNGTCGSVHTNDDLSITGTGNLIAQNATASDQYSVSGSPTIGGVAGGSRPKKVIPAINPATLLTQATSAVGSDTSNGTVLYEFLSTGQVYRTTRTGPGATSRVLQTTVADNASYLGWEFRDNPTEKWTLQSATPPGTAGASPPDNPSKAIFYVGGKAVIDADVGSSGSRWNATVIATGDIDVNANSDPYIAAAMSDMIFATGGNLNINGNPNIDQGIIAAAGNIDIGGNVTITGSMIARGETRLHGTVQITYSCGLNSGLTAGLSEIAWGY